MKKTEIAAKVFEAMETVPLSELSGGELMVQVADIIGLSMVPWFCDVSVQWALRLTIPGRMLKRSLLKKVRGSFVSVNEDGAMLIGVPGDGIEPSTSVLLPLVEEVAKIAEPRMRLELAAANLGVVKRDWDAKAETNTPFGNQRYLGIIDSDGLWAIRQTIPGLTKSVLADALTCGRMVVHNGPWVVSSEEEAHAILMQWLGSAEANVNPMAVKQFISFKDGAFSNRDPGMTRKLCGLGLGFFRHRLAGGPFRWPAPGPIMYSVEQLEDVARFVVGHPL